MGSDCRVRGRRGPAEPAAAPVLGACGGRRRRSEDSRLRLRFVFSSLGRASLSRAEGGLREGNGAVPQR